MHSQNTSTQEKSERQEAWPEEDVKSVQEAWREFKGALRGTLPDEFWEHRRAARKEMLLAVRSLVDSAIEHLEEEEHSQRKRAQKIEIE